MKFYKSELELKHGHGLELGLRRDLETEHGIELGNELEHGHRSEGAKSSKNILAYVLEV